MRQVKGYGVLARRHIFPPKKSLLFLVSLPLYLYHNMHFISTYTFLICNMLLYPVCACRIPYFSVTQTHANIYMYYNNYI